MDGTGGYTGAGTDQLMELDHELRASLYGIEAMAGALNEHRDRLPSGDVDQLVLAMASEARRLRLMLAPPAEQRAAFDLAEAIGPAILMTRSLGVVVHDAVPTGIWVQGCRDDTAQVVLALLDNARVHAAPSEVDARATSTGGITTLYIEDRGPGITGVGHQPMLERGRRGPKSSGSGLGLFIARRLMIGQGGSLRIDSRPGGGASLALTLPSSPSRSLAQLPRVASQPAVVR